MGAVLGTPYTGSMTLASGQADKDRWIFVGSQTARTLTIQETGPALPTADNMIKTDIGDFIGLALHVKCVKTVSGQDDIDFSVRELYSWCGTDEAHMVRLSYDGTNAFGGLYIDEGSQSAPDHIANCQSNKLVLNDMQLNQVVDTYFRFRSNLYGTLTIPCGFVGVHVRLHSAAAPAITTTNTWTFAFTWCYWF